MRLLAVDQGSVSCGLALFDGDELVDARRIRGRGETWSTRMRSIAARIRELASGSEWRPDVVAIEDVVGHRGHPNPQTLVTMGETRGYLACLFDDVWPTARQLAIHPAKVRGVIGAPRSRAGAKEFNRRAVQALARVELESEDENDAVIVGMAALQELRAKSWAAIADAEGERIEAVD